jgi:hypothetical protein
MIGHKIIRDEAAPREIGLMSGGKDPIADFVTSEIRRPKVLETRHGSPQGERAMLDRSYGFGMTRASTATPPVVA